LLILILKPSTHLHNQSWEVARTQHGHTDELDLRPEILETN
jgi:hypothetical protein